MCELSRVLCFAMACSTLLSAEDKNQSTTRLDETDSKLFAFCRMAVLHDRGLTCTIFAKNTDRWIVDQLLPKDSFRQALDASKDTSSFNAPKDAASTRASNQASEGIVARYQQKDESTNTLYSRLSADQRSRLPGVYLRMEGLVALTRSGFAGLFENQETPQRIRQLAEDTFREKAAPVHRAIFAMKDVDELATYHSELRLISADLDWRIVQLLTAIERQRLLEIIQKSRSLDDAVSGAPPF